MGEVMRVLCADDEPHALESLRQLISADPGLELIGSCSSGDEAIRLARELAPDLLVLDIRMPGASGLDVVAALDPEARPHHVAWGLPSRGANCDESCYSCGIHRHRDAARPRPSVRSGDDSPGVSHRAMALQGSTPLPAPRLIPSVKPVVGEECPKAQVPALRQPGQAAPPPPLEREGAIFQHATHGRSEDRCPPSPDPRP